MWLLQETWKLLTLLSLRFEPKRIYSVLPKCYFYCQKLKKYLDKKSRILFFNSYILPIFDYCSNVWGNLNDEGIQRITKLQKRAARIILDAPFLTPTRKLFENLNWLSFCDRISYNKLVLVYKILHDKTPNYLKKLCIPSGSY